MPPVSPIWLNPSLTEDRFSALSGGYSTNQHKPNPGCFTADREQNVLLSMLLTLSEFCAADLLI